jgi:hypothetical protein
VFCFVLRFIIEKITLLERILLKIQQVTLPQTWPLLLLKTAVRN